MDLLKSGLSVVILVGLALMASLNGSTTFLVLTFLPYIAGAIFLAGFVWRVNHWARSPVPFRIPTTCGQQKSLSWINPSRLDNPSSGLGAVGRVILEVILFRSLFRNNRSELDGQRYVYGDSKFLWLGGLAFHISMLVILLRHLRLFVQPVPYPVFLLARIDGFFQVGSPVLYLTNVIMLTALIYLLLRRINDPRLSYISQFSDYFAPFLLLGIALTGVLMRYATKVDVVAVKKLTLGLAAFRPVVPEEIGALFLIHVVLVCVLAVYFTFSKLMHMGGVFLSPTRNLANNSRMKRHINPWNYPVKTHPYQEWQDEFHDKIIKAGIPLDGATHGRSTTSD